VGIGERVRGPGRRDLSPKLLDLGVLRRCQLVTLRQSLGMGLVLSVEPLRELAGLRASETLNSAEPQGLAWVDQVHILDNGLVQHEDGLVAPVTPCAVAILASVSPDFTT